jgi:hypothetical protein
MKKIGILNYHDGINHGAFLQCYALYKFIEIQGHNVEVINYKNSRHWFAEYRYFLVRKNIISIIRNIIKIIKFKKCHRKMKMTASIRRNKRIYNYNYDCVLVGSDEVWNYTNPMVGYDITYFGEGINTVKIGSYAASFGWLEANTSLPSEIKNRLMNFSYISVRDDNSKAIIKNNIDLDVDILVDPTFLYNFNGCEVKYKNAPQYMDDYILVYAPGIIDDSIEKKIREMYGDKREIVSIGRAIPWADKNITDVDPFEWLWFFKNSSFIVTSSFHGTIFSIKYGKQFISIPNKASYNKIDYLLRKLHLSDRLLSTESDIDKFIDAEINYNKVYDILNDDVDRSKNALFSFLS